MSEVTTPKRAPPAPRSAQQQVRLVGVDDAPVGEHDLRARRLSEVSPCRRPRIPRPPPSVRPAMPTVGPQPAGMVRPWASSAS